MNGDGSPDELLPPPGRLQRSQSERIKDRAKAFMRRMGSSSRRRKAEHPHHHHHHQRHHNYQHVDRENLVIGQPTLISHFSASPQTMRMFPDDKLQQQQQQQHQQQQQQHQQKLMLDSGSSLDSSTRSASHEKRKGMVLLTPVTPEGRLFDDHAILLDSTAKHDKLSFTSGHSTKPYKLDSNCNLEMQSECDKSSSSEPTRDSDRPAFVPRTPTGAAAAAAPGRTGIRTNANVAPAPSPLMQRKLIQASLRDMGTAADPHTGPSTTITTNGSPVQSRRRITQNGAAESVSSPEFTPRLGTRALQVEVIEENRSLQATTNVTTTSVRSRLLGAHSASTGINNQGRSHSSLDSSDTSDSPRFGEQPERRDSGVGSSLSRSPSGPGKQQQQSQLLAKVAGGGHKCQLQQQQHQLVVSTAQKTSAPAWSGDSQLSLSTTSDPRVFVDAFDGTQMDALSLPQLIKLKKFAYLKLTALIERYSPSTARRNSNWGVQKLFRKMKSPELKVAKDRQIFGAALASIAQRTGLSLPRCILSAMRFLRQQAPETVGIFRKNGVKSRIQELKDSWDFCCSSSSVIAKSDKWQLEQHQVHDVADLLKQYFRDLPEPLMTQKLSDTFTSIHQYVPYDLRLEAMQNAVLLLPDENREALQTLLYFLRDIAYYADVNQMTAQNLAVCFAPSLFQLCPRLTNISPTRRHKTIGPAGLPNEKEMRENQAAQLCLTQMIMECRQLFLVPKSVFERYYMDPDIASTSELGYESSLLSASGGGLLGGDFRCRMDAICTELLKEHNDRWRGWFSEGSCEGLEISSKKSSDFYPLKFWKCFVDVEAPPKEVLTRLLRERQLWDEQTLDWRVLATFGEDCEIFQYVINDTPPHPTRDCVVVRQWQRDLRDLRGGCVLVESSFPLDQDAQLLGGVRALVLASRFLVEPSGAGRSRVTYVSRVDLRGRSLQWYSKVYSHCVCRHMAKLRDSFRHQTADFGPETKI